MTANSQSIDRIPVLLRGAWFGLNRCLRSEIRKLGITTAQYTALRCIRENKGLSQVALAKLLSTNKNNCSGLVKRLCHLNLIQKKVTSSDLRTNEIKITAKGKKIFTQAEEKAKQLHLEVLNQLPKNAEEKLIKYLGICHDSLEGKEKS